MGAVASARGFDALYDQRLRRRGRRIDSARSVDARSASARARCQGCSVLYEHMWFVVEADMGWRDMLMRVDMGVGGGHRRSRVGRCTAAYDWQR